MDAVREVSTVAATDAITDAIVDTLGRKCDANLHLTKHVVCLTIAYVAVKAHIYGELSSVGQSARLWPWRSWVQFP